MRKTVTIAQETFTIEAAPADGGWQASARRTGGERYGPTLVDSSADQAVTRVEHWLAWQYEHDVMLRALQEAEQVYHRTITGSAFAAATDGPSATELQSDALHRLERARLALDAVRARKPE
jgi:hypothetical protein